MLPIPASWRRRLGRIRILQPLGERDYAPLTAGSLISLLGALLFAPGIRDPERQPRTQAI